MNTKCICNGMNEECIYCGGSGYITDEKVEIIKTAVDKKKLKKEKQELENYLHEGATKIFDNGRRNFTKKRKSKRIKTKRKSKAKRNSKSKKKTITIKELRKEEPLKYVGPKNPNRKSNTHTKKRKQEKKK